MLKVYIEDIAAKLEGNSTGSWITLPIEENELIEEIDEILKRGEVLSRSSNLHQECEIKDYEWDEDVCEIFSINTDDDIYKINNDLILIEDEAQPYEYKIIKFLLDDNYAYAVENAIEKLDEVSLYEDCSLENVASQMFDDIYGSEINETITYYIDFKQWGEDLRHDGYVQIGKDVFHYPF